MSTTDRTRIVPGTSPDDDDGRPPAGVAPGIGRTPHRGSLAPLAVLAALLGGAGLGGCSSCDGGISGTGCGGVSGELGTSESDGSGDAAIGGADAMETASVRAFENQTSALDGIAVGLRAVNLSSRAVDLVAGGTLRTDALAPGAVGPVVPLDNFTRMLEIVDDATNESLERFDATLVPQSLTTLVVFDAPGGTPRVEPLVTRASTDDDAVALVRIVYATLPPAAGDRVAALSLVPAGDAPGGAAVDFVSEGPISIASAYESVAAGDYALSVPGDAAELPVSFDGGRAYTLFLADTGGPDGDGRFVRLVDGDTGGGPGDDASRRTR